MSAEDRRTFDRWLKVNAAAGLVLAAGLVAMALVGAVTPRDASVASNSNAPNIVASEKNPKRSGVWSR